MEHVWNFLQAIKRALIPLTSFLTVALVSYISYVYIYVYLPILDFNAQNNEG